MSTVFDKHPRRKSLARCGGSERVVPLDRAGRDGEGQGAGIQAGGQRPPDHRAADPSSAAQATARATSPRRSVIPDVWNPTRRSWIRSKTQAPRLQKPCRVPAPWKTSNVFRVPGPTCRAAMSAWPEYRRPSAVEPDSSPSSISEREPTTTRASHCERPCLSSQRSIVALGIETPPKVTPYRANRWCLVVTYPPYTPMTAFLPGRKSNRHRIFQAPVGEP
jgi:hypothetical protein